MTRLNHKDTIHDFEELHRILESYFDSVPSDGWQQRTGSRDQDWTVHQTLAHLVSIARLLNRAVKAAIKEEDFVIDGIRERRDLRAWNDRQIEMFAQHEPSKLAEKLFAEFDTATNFIQTLAPEDFYKTAYARVYNRPAPVMDIIDWQLSHAGAVHGAQITRPITEPLWEKYTSEFAHRLIDRYLRHFSVAYWNTVGGDCHETINFTVGGEGGGEWHLIAAPDGGSAGPGAVVEAEHHLRFENPNILFGVFSVHIPFVDAIRSRQMQVDGDFRETFDLIRLFSASPPKV